MATYVRVYVACNLTSGSGYASAWGGSTEYKAHFSGTSYTRSDKVFEIGDVLTVHAKSVAGYTCVTETLKVTKADDHLLVRYEKNSTPPAKPKYTITLKTSPTEGGYITKNSSSTGAITSDIYEQGESFKFYARPNSGYSFSHWGVSSSSYTTTSNPPPSDVCYADRNET